MASNKKPGEAQYQILANNDDRPKIRDAQIPLFPERVRYNTYIFGTCRYRYFRCIYNLKKILYKETHKME